MRRFSWWAWALGAIVFATACGPKPAPNVPGPPPAFQLQVRVSDGTNPVLSAVVSRSNDCAEPVNGHCDTPLTMGVSEDGSAAWLVTTGAGFNACARADGYEPACVPVSEPITQSLPIILVKRVGPPPVVEPPPATDITPITYPPPARDGLAGILPVPDPSVGDDSCAGLCTRDPYDLGLTFVPPQTPSPDYVRGNFGGIDFPECHLSELDAGVEGMPEHAMSWFLPQYDVPQQVCVLRGHQRRGYTHYGTYFPWSLNQGVSVAVYGEMLQRVKRAGLWNVVTLFGGDGEDFETRIKPHLEMWLQHGAIGPGDILVGCWQCDGKYEPWNLTSEVVIPTARWAHEHGMFFALHWYGGRIAWWNAWDDGRRPSTCYNAGDLGLPNFCDRFETGRAWADLVDFQFQQFDPWAAIEDVRDGKGGIAGELRDSLRAIYGRTKLVVAEYDTQRRFDNPRSTTEAEGDLKGFILLSVRDAQGRSASGGFFGGARLINGAWVH